MSETKEKFLDLLNNARSTDESVADAVLALNKKLKVKTKELEGDELRNYIWRLGDNILSEAYNAEKKMAGEEGRSTPQITLDSFPKATQELLNFAAQFEPAMKTGVKPSDPDFIACKDPITDLKVTFDEVAGQEKAKRQISLQYIYPISYPSLFTTRSRGIMFYGTPGTGKSLMAKAATTMLPDVAFYAPSPGELKGKYEGDTEKNIGRVFECAAEQVEDPESKYNYAVIFIDEFDSLAGAGRGEDPSMARSVNTLLQMMDGIKSNENVSVIAATNYPWNIDSAILSRFGSKIFIDIPDDDARNFLIRFELAANYSSPVIGKEKRTKRLIRERDSETKKVTKWKDDYMQNIAKWGWPQCVRTEIREHAGFVTTTKTEEKVQTHLTDDNILEIVKMLGPTEEGQLVINKITSGEKVDVDEYADKEPMFGYSGRDISNLMKLAIQNASLRALENGLFSEIEIRGRKYYISTTIDDKPTHALYEDLAKEYGIPEISEEDRGKLLNFSICVGDIKEAVENYPFKINNKDYIEVLTYATTGIGPE